MALAMPSASGNGHDLKTQARVIFTGSPGNLVAGYHGYTDAALTRYFAQAFSRAASRWCLHSMSPAGSPAALLRGSSRADYLAIWALAADAAKR